MDWATMSLLFPDRNGTWSATDDSRLSLDSSLKTGWLTSAHGLLLIGVGNPLLHQDYYSEYNGGSNAVYHLLTNQNENLGTSPGYWSIHFEGWGSNVIADRETFSLKFRPNGGSQVSFIVRSPVVTHTNCAYIGIERNGDDYAIHLYDKNGVKTAGTFATHVAGSLGMTMRSSAYTVWVGSNIGLQSIQTSGHWRSMLENLTLVEQASAFTTLDTKVANVINGSDPVTEFGATEVKIWRTLEDLTSAGLAAAPTATSDTLPAISVAAFSRVEVGSPIAAPDTQCVRLDEQKYNFYGLLGTETSTTIAVSGTYLGTVTNVEGRLVNKATDVVVQDWATLDTAVAGGTWSGSFTGVAAGEYYIELRPSNATANVYKGRNYHTVAYIFFWHGQSQLAIAWESKAALAGTYTPIENLPATARAYYVGRSDSSTQGDRVAFMRMSGQDDYGDALHSAQVEWERTNPGVPVVWVFAALPGQSLLQALNGDNGYIGDGTTWNSGIFTDLKLALGTDKVNVAYQWITSDISQVEEEYRNRILGWLFNEYSGAGTDYSGVLYNHFTDFFDASFGLALSVPARATTTVLDNFTADPVSDDYGSITEKRELQRALVAEWAADATKTGRYIVGPSVNDMHIEAAGGPHQPGIGEGAARYAGGTPRLGSRLGIAAAWLSTPTVYSPPTLGSASFTSTAKTAFSIPVSLGSFGAIKNGSGTSAVSGFEISADNGVIWNRKGFSAELSGNTVTITKTTGDWTAVPDEQLLWRYHSGGPYSYGTSYTAEADADILLALYGTAANENGLGIPVSSQIGAVSLAAEIPTGGIDGIASPVGLSVSGSVWSPIIFGP